MNNSNDINLSPEDDNKLQKNKVQSDSQPTPQQKNNNSEHPSNEYIVIEEAEEENVKLIKINPITF